MLRFYGKLTGLRGRRLRARASELLELVRLTNAARRRVGTYSKGMLQRIGLAQALIGNPRLLVLDEPTAGLDPAGVMAIRDLLLSLKRRGLTILLSSHLLGQVQEVCDRVAILAQGALVREGPLEELLRRDTRTQIVLENASPPLLEEIGKLATRGGAQLLACRPDQTSLERLFLEATESATPPP
jgi:ABC-2 type transport system ATP-binding protein